MKTPWFLPVHVSLSAMLVAAVLSGTSVQAQYSLRVLGTLGGTWSEAKGINSAGEVVGMSTLPGDTVHHAFLYAGGAMIDLGTSGGATSYANGVNDARQVVGRTDIDGWPHTHAFLYSGSVMTDLGTLPGGDSSEATGINGAGQVAGGSFALATASNFSYLTWRAFRVSGGVMHNLGVLGGFPQSSSFGTYIYSESFAYGIDDAGQVVGQSTISGDTPRWHAFLYSNEAMQDLGSFGGNSCALGMNKGGDVVGYSYSDVPGDGAYHAFLYSGGQMRRLGTLGLGSAAQGINDAGQIVGYYLMPDGASHAFLYQGGVMRDLNELAAVPGWVLADAWGINNKGQIAGTALNADGYLRAYVLAPVELVDNTPPTIKSLTADPDHLGLPRGKMAGVQITADVTDNIDPSPVAKIISVTSNQPIVDGIDYIATGELTILLKSISTAPPAPRIYIITVQCVDSSGNASERAILLQTQQYLFKDLGTLGGTASLGMFINEIGQVAGESATLGDVLSHAFLYSFGQMYDVGRPGEKSYPTGLNGSGQVVGNLVLNGGGTRAFLYAFPEFPVVKDLGTLGGRFSGAIGINNSGEIVGESEIIHVFEGYAHAFLYAGGVMRDLGDLGQDQIYFSSATGINDAGQVIGWSDGAVEKTGGTGRHGFIYAGGMKIDMGTLTPGWGPSIPQAINDAGQVFGWCYTFPGKNHLFVYDGGVMRDLGTLGATNIHVAGVNEAGWVTGANEWEHFYHAFLYSGGAGMDDLGTLGGAANYSRGWGINNFGQVVGESVAPGDGSPLHAFFYDGGVMSDLNDFVYAPGWILFWARGINDSGQIVGTARNAAGHDHAYLLTLADAAPPVLGPLPANQTLEATSHNGAVATWPAASAVDKIDGNVPVDFNPLPGSAFPLGHTLVACSATDSSGNSSAYCYFDIFVRDTIPPLISNVIASPNTLGLANGPKVLVTVTVNATDVADPSPVGRIVSVTCSRALAAGDVVMDTLDPLKVTLKGATPGQPGRVYTLNVESRDASGNARLSSVTVTVAGLPPAPKGR